MFRRECLILMCLVIAAGCTQQPSPPSTQLPNPASQYCESHGHALEIRTDESGGQYGVCVFTWGGECDEWKYFRAECGCDVLAQEFDAYAGFNPNREVCDPLIGTSRPGAWVGGTVTNITEPFYVSAYNRYEYTLSLKGKNRERDLHLISANSTLPYTIGTFYTFDLVGGLCSTYYSMASSGAFDGRLLPADCSQ